jgi:hypothetical protein
MEIFHQRGRPAICLAKRATSRSNSSGVCSLNGLLSVARKAFVTDPPDTDDIVCTFLLQPESTR